MGLTDAQRQARFRAKRQAELERLRKLVTPESGKPTKAAAAPPPSAKVMTRTAGKPDTDDQRTIRGLQSALGRTRELLAKAEAKLHTMPPGERDREVERLKTENRNLKIQVKHTVEIFDERRHKLDARERQLSKPMPDATHRAIMKALHPDRQPSDAERAAALSALNAWNTDMAKRRA